MQELQLPRAIPPPARHSPRIVQRTLEPPRVVFAFKQEMIMLRMLDACSAVKIECVRLRAMRLKVH